MKKTLLVLLALLMGLLGCAAIPPLTHDQCNATKFPTAHEHEACLKAAGDYEQAEHEREDRRLIKRDEIIIMFLNACDADPRLVIVEVIRGSSRRCLPSSREKRKAMKEYGYKYTHENVCSRAFSQDFQCWDRYTLAEAIRRLNGRF